MKITAKGKYALMLMMDLAMNHDGTPIRLKDIARRQNISEKFLEQIIATLNKAGMVQSIRGAQGGYMLKLPPEKYTVGMILRCVEGDFSPVRYVNGELDNDDDDTSVIFRVWEQINTAVNNVVDNITLATLIEWQYENADQYII
jgi:Rrf2 family protein